MIRVRSRAVGALIFLVLVADTAAVHAADIASRTERVTQAAGQSAGNRPSSTPSVDGSGRFVVYSSAATNLVPVDPNGAIRDVFIADRLFGEHRILSLGVSGGAADGPSTEPAISGDGQRVAFTSAATNLVPGDTNGVTDVFVRDQSGAVVMASVTPTGQPGNRPSSRPDLSADGRFLVFESEASDLVEADSNGHSDVFVRDLLTSTTRRASVSSANAQGNARSGAPAISGNGRVVSFESSANNLVRRDRNRRPDVFVRDLHAGRTAIVSISSSGKQQNDAVPAPFHMVSDLDETGRRVVFESDATNLVSADANESTDVFLRDRKTRTTRIVSASSTNVQGNNDTISPRITPSGRFVAFQSFATNYEARDSSGPDVYLRDLDLRVTTPVSVPTDGTRRAREARQILQRPALSDAGDLVVFSSTAANLTPARRTSEDVYVRRTTAARTLIKKRSKYSVQLSADDPAAKDFICRVDKRPAFKCGPTVSLAQSGASLVVRAAGPGLLADPIGRRFRTIRDKTRPVVRLTRYPKSRSSRTIRGRATDRGGAGIKRVEVAVTYLTSNGSCYFLDRTRFRKTRNCKLRSFRNVARGRSSWSLTLPRKLPVSFVGIAVRAVDASGNVSTTVERVRVLR